MSTTVENAPVVVYQFHVLLLQISPAIWRRILVPSDTTVANLHFILQIIMGWQDRHINRFLLHGQQYGVATARRPSFATDPLLPIAAWQLRPAERFLYLYNLFANWQIQLRLEKLLPHDPSVAYPCCLSGARQGPPEFCDGAAEFMALRDHYTPAHVERRLLAIRAICQGQETMLDNYHAELGRLEYWRRAGHFDCQAVNRRLQQ